MGAAVKQASDEQKPAEKTVKKQSLKARIEGYKRDYKVARKFLSDEENREWVKKEAIPEVFKIEGTKAAVKKIAAFAAAAAVGLMTFVSGAITAIFVAPAIALGVAGVGVALAAGSALGAYNSTKIFREKFEEIKANVVANYVVSRGPDLAKEHFGVVIAQSKQKLADMKAAAGQKLKDMAKAKLDSARGLKDRFKLRGRKKDRPSAHQPPDVPPPQPPSSQPRP